MRVTGKPNYLEKILFQCHFVRHKSHMDWCEIEPWPPGERLATDSLNHDMATK